MFKKSFNFLRFLGLTNIFTMKYFRNFKVIGNRFINLTNDQCCKIFINRHTGIQTLTHTHTHTYQHTLIKRIDNDSRLLDPYS